MATVYRHRRGEYYIDQGIAQPMFTRQTMGDHIETCSFCDERNASAFWIFPDIQVCRSCAIDKLVRLIADAVVGEDGNTMEPRNNLENYLHQIRAVFYEAALAAVLRQHREPPLPPNAQQTNRKPAAKGARKWLEKVSKS